MPSVVDTRDFPEDPVFDSMLPLQGAQVQSLVRELRSPHATRPETKNKNSMPVVIAKQLCKYTKNH